MCDYSLHGMNSRLAVDGERLIVHRFRTGSIGMASEADLCSGTANSRPWHWLIGRPARISNCAVCIAPGARLVLHDIPARLRRELGIAASEEVVFTQLTAEPNAYRDAIRFRNGAEVLLQRLEVGQRVDVVSVSSLETMVETTDLDHEAAATAYDEAWRATNWV